MQNLYDFYNSILNIKKEDNTNIEAIIKKVVLEEKELIKGISKDLEVFCKILATNISERLKDYGIKTHWIDLQELTGIDHVVLISEYKSKQETKRVLIDPSYVQFVKKNDAKLLKLETWPSEKLADKTIMQDLLETGITELNDTKWKDYLQSFSKEKITTNLNQFLLEQSLEKITKK